MFLPVLYLHVGSPFPEPVAVIYPPASVHWKEMLDHTISELTNSRLPPSRILFICPMGRHAPLVDAFRAQQTHLRERLRATTHVVAAAYNRRGYVSRDKVFRLWSMGDEWVVTDELVERAAKQYIAEICSRTNAVLNAPPGYQFQKPSRSTSSIFLRAGNMLREIDSVNAYANLLMRKWRFGAKRIYIDSFTILSFAMALQDVIRLFADNDSDVPLIENFHSYDKSDGLSFPEDGNYLVIVSGSTSGELADQLVRRHGAFANKIVHLIGAGEEEYQQEFANSCIHFHPHYVDRPVALDEIRIGGEEFLPSYGQPARVRLTTAHIKGEDARRYKDEFYQKYLKIQSIAKGAGYDSYSLFSISNDTYDLGPSDFDNWLVDQLAHEVPASVRLIIHLADDMSKALAKRIAAKILPSLSSTGVVAVDGISATVDGPSRGQAVLVVASEDPNLEGFVRANTELRRWPDAHRHFVLGHAFPEAKEDFNQTVGSLRLRSGERLRYGWSSYATVAVGRVDHHTKWLFDYPVDLRSSLTQSIDIPNSLVDALHAYAAGNHIFLPKLCGGWLNLRPGSVFFEGDYDSLSEDVIYLVVATAVQRVREGGGRGQDAPRFDSNPFVGSVMDPQMFSRYSDGILQAALLRCLYPSELDYSRSTVLSQQVRELFIAVVRNATNVVGEAALEFMAALAAKKVSLEQEDRSIVVGEIENNERLAPLWKAFTEEPLI